MDFKKQYFNVWNEAWSFHKEFAGMVGTDEDWQRLVDASDAIAEKHKGKTEYEFIESLILVVVNELERQNKRKQQQSDMKNEL